MSRLKKDIKKYQQQVVQQQQTSQKCQKVEELQTEIIQLYTGQLTKSCTAYDLSMPHIPRISERYLETRVVVVGQETNEYFPKERYTDFRAPGADIEKLTLIDRYDQVIRVIDSNSGGNFFSFGRELHKQSILKGDMVEGMWLRTLIKKPGSRPISRITHLNRGRLSHVWINLFVMEAVPAKDAKLTNEENKKNRENGRPTENEDLRKYVLEIQEDLIYKVLCKLEPELIVFLTGPNLDEVVAEHALNLPEGTGLSGYCIDPLGVFAQRQLMEIKLNLRETDPLYRTKILRLYHPTIYSKRINDKRWGFIDTAQQKTGKKPAVHYQDVVMAYLKEWNGPRPR